MPFLVGVAFPLLHHAADGIVTSTAVLTFCACTPPLSQVLHLWDFLLAYGVHMNILCVVAQLFLMRDDLLSSKSYVFSQTIRFNGAQSAQANGITTQHASVTS